MTFEEWLDEIEAFSSRRERLNEDVDFAAVMVGNMSHTLAQKRMYTWLEAAYNVGKKAGLQEVCDLMLSDIEGDFDYILFQLKNMIKESK